MALRKPRNEAERQDLSRAYAATYRLVTEIVPHHTYRFICPNGKTGQCWFSESGNHQFAPPDSVIIHTYWAAVAFGELDYDTVRAELVRRFFPQQSNG